MEMTDNCYYGNYLEEREDSQWLMNLYSKEERGRGGGDSKKSLKRTRQ